MKAMEEMGFDRCRTWVEKYQKNHSTRQSIVRISYSEISHSTPFNGRLGCPCLVDHDRGRGPQFPRIF